MQILVLTSDKSMRLLQGFAHLWDKYAAELVDAPIDVAGYSPLPFVLPKNYTYHSLGDFADYPVKKWTDGLLKALDLSDDPVVLLLFDDYWLVRGVNVHAIGMASRLMYARPEILRFDLSSDRLYADGIESCGYMGCYDLICSNPTIPYHFSLQAGLWNRELLKQVVVPNEDPWECEMRGTARVAAHTGTQLENWQVLSTRQVPMKYLIAMQGGRLALDGGYQVPRLQINQFDIDEIRALGYLAGLE